MNGAFAPIVYNCSRTTHNLISEFPEDMGTNIEIMDLDVVHVD